MRRAIGATNVSKPVLYRWVDRLTSDYLATHHQPYGMTKPKRRRAVKSVGVLIAGLLLSTGCRMSHKPAQVPASLPPMPPASRLSRAAVVAVVIPPKPQPEFVDLPIQSPAGRVSISSSTDLVLWSVPVTISLSRPRTIIIRDYNEPQIPNRFYRLTPVP